MRQIVERICAKGGMRMKSLRRSIAFLVIGVLASVVCPLSGLPLQRPPSGPIVMRCRAMGGDPDRLPWKRCPRRHFKPHSLIQERAARMDQSTIYGLRGTESDSIRRYCSIHRARSWRIRASTSLLAVDSLVPLRGQVQLAATREAKCGRFRVLSRRADRGWLPDCRNVHPYSGRSGSSSRHNGTFGVLAVELSGAPAGPE